MGTTVGHIGFSGALRRPAWRLVAVAVLVLSALFVPGRAVAALDVSLTADRQVAAPGETVTFTTSGNVGGSPTFSWTVDGNPIATTAPRSRGPSRARASTPSR